MKTINLNRDHNIRDAGDCDEILPVLETIRLLNDNENDIVLDLRKCLIDYPGTSAIIDKIFDKWIMNSDFKSLTIILDYQLKMKTILSWLFLGSKYLNKIDTSQNSPDSNLEENIEKTLNLVKAKLIIKIDIGSGTNIEKTYE
jgi:hypothetical protein